MPDRSHGTANGAGSDDVQRPTPVAADPRWQPTTLPPPPPPGLVPPPLLAPPHLPVPSQRAEWPTPAAPDGVAESQPVGPARDRLRIVCALVIASISVVAALISWRAEVAGSRAADVEQRGSVAAVEAQGHVLRFESQARAEERLMRRWKEHEEAARELRVQLEQAGSTELADELTRRVEVERRVTEKLAFTFPEDYMQQGGDGDGVSLSYDVDRRVADLLKENRVDTDVARFFQAADRDQSHRRTLVRLDIVLVLALAAATVAQLSRRRLISVLWLAPGLLAFVVATATFVAVEV